LRPLLKIVRYASPPAFFILLLITGLLGQAKGQQFTITATVHDSSGAVISGADVELRAEHSTQLKRTGPDGVAAFTGLTDSRGTVHVTANSFAPVEQKWSADSENVQITIVLRAPGASDRIVVSATRSEMRLSEVPGGAIALSTEDLQANPALALDDLLRQVPGFSLFRRASSRVANPTTQGVSLRGVGASGPSRALVLEDGVPLVDPFGGWIYWDRIPRAQISSVEVLRGGSSSLYGSDALGGVVQFLSRIPNEPSISIDASYGTENTPDVSVWAGASVSKWDLSGAADMAHTDGYILVPSSQRGTIDTAANSEHATVDGQLGYKISDNGRAFLRATFFDEGRDNGTPFQKNSTSTGFGVAGVSSTLGVHDSIMARVFGEAQGYDQTFSSIRSVNSPRDQELPTDIQHVPSQVLGGAAQWNHTVRGHTLIFGADIQEVMGASDEQLLLASALKVAGGRQFSSGLFGEDIFRVASKWTLIAGGRWDRWKNFDGSSARTPVPSGNATIQAYPDRIENSFNPRLSLMRALRSNMWFSVSGYRAFRAPTLNELYRTFQQGNTTTLNNPSLRAERLTGAEASLKSTAFENRLETRATVFWNDIVDPVTNVTLNSTTRQRQNLGRTRSIGAELDGAFRLTSVIQISGGYQYTDATVVDSPTLLGLDVLGVPRHQFTWGARYWQPTRVMLSVQGRYAGAQFDDDLNTLKLDQYYVMGLYAGRQFRGGLVGYMAAENVLSRRYAVALTPSAGAPIITQGPPILARIGVRYDFPASRR
jgi:outer membrane receptor protein involved in Fe transport